MGDNPENNTTDRGAAVPYSAARPTATTRLGSPSRPADMALLEAAACSGPLIDTAEQLQDRIDDASGPDGCGRPQYRAVDALMFRFAALLWGSQRAAADRLGDPVVWERLADAQRTARPGLDPRLRLSPTAPTRQQYYRFAQRWADDIAGLRPGEPELDDVAAEVVYGMDLGDSDAFRLLSGGIVPISAVRRDRGGQPAVAGLGPHRFEGGGETAVLDVVSVGGEPAIDVSGDDGTEACHRLELVSVKRRSSEQGAAVYAEYRVPAGPQVPERLVGLSTLIQVDSTSEEAEDGRRTEPEVRPFPQQEGQEPDSPHTARSDAEAANQHLKRGSGGRRASGS
ncbi:MAG: hypothetical protein OXI32_03230 [bacterium]|nr:hypothetical protein [bacterium]